MSPTRHLRWLGANERAIEHARLLRRYEEVKRRKQAFGSLTDDVELMAAIAALERFEEEWPDIGGMA